MTDYDITDIEKLASDAVRNLGVSTHVWNNRPKATDDSTKPTSPPMSRVVASTTAPGPMP